MQSSEVATVLGFRFINTEKLQIIMINFFRNVATI